MNNFELEFSNIINILKTPTKDSLYDLRKLLVKLNNKNYYNKYIKSHPGIDFGYYNNTITNPLLLCIKNMIKLLNSKNLSISDLIKKLQEEVSWAYNSYLYSAKTFRRKTATLSH